MQAREAYEKALKPGTRPMWQSTKPWRYTGTSLRGGSQTVPIGIDLAQQRRLSRQLSKAVQKLLLESETRASSPSRKMRDQRMHERDKLPWTLHDMT